MPQTIAPEVSSVQIPCGLTLEDYNSTEKISNLAKKLSTKGAPAGIDPSAGDIAYYAPWATWRSSTRTSVFARPREARADRFTRGRVPATRNAASDDSPNRGVAGRERIDQGGRRGMNDERQGD